MPQDESAVVAALAARLFPHAVSLTIERMSEGVSTRVYRLCCAGGVYYLRVLPEEGAGFAAEALAHRLLLERGVRVPEVLYVEHCHPVLQRAIMVTAEIPGRPLRASAGAGDVKGILREAGRQMALMNATPVRGFGWICREGDSPRELTAELPDWETFVHAQVDRHLPRLAAAGVLSSQEVEATRRTVAHYARHWSVPQATLAHGDLDSTHIYHDGPAYSGIIDFGEIRGTDPYYDLAWFALEDGAWLPHLLEGYAEVASLPADYTDRLRFTAFYVAVDRLGRRLVRQGAIGQGDSDLRFIQSAIGSLRERR